MHLDLLSIPVRGVLEVSQVESEETLEFSIVQYSTVQYRAIIVKPNWLM